LYLYVDNRLLKLIIVIIISVLSI